MEKTNVMRLLSANKITYTAHEYPADITDGQKVAEALGENPDMVFKTLVTVANTKEHFVFVVPVNATLNLKKAASAAGVKNIEMLKQKELLPLTGYIHGGCSPIGMKKPFRTFIEESASLYDTIIFSGGKRGFQVEMSPSDLCSFIGAEFSDLV